MNRDEQSLLLYLETCAVDHCGKVDQMKMNDTDRKIIDRWVKDGFIAYGRICFKDCKAGSRTQLTNWVILSEDAWISVQQLRKERAKRMWKNRSFVTTEEKKDKNYGEYEE